MFKNGVASYTPIMTRFQKDMVGQTFVCDLVRRYANDVWTTDADSSVEMCEFSGLEIWSDQGWTALHRVVRYVQMTYEPPSSVLRQPFLVTPLHCHRLCVGSSFGKKSPPQNCEAKLRFRQGFHSPKKKMMRVVTDHGIVDVTDGHSLFTRDGAEISIEACTVGTRILHVITDMQTIKPPDTLILRREYEKLMKTVDMTTPDTITEKYYESTIDCTKTPMMVSMHYLCKLADGIIHPGQHIVIHQDASDNKQLWSEIVYDAFLRFGIRMNTGYSRYTDTFVLTYDPNESLGGSEALLRDAKASQETVAGEPTKEVRRSFALICDDRDGRIKCILEIPYQGFVYELTTENRHYVAGIGNIIAHG
jgi:hypothetical protein